MSQELRIPSLGESVNEVMISRLLKAPGEFARRDEGLVLLESDKAAVELPAPDDGTVEAWLTKEGDTVKIGDVVGRFAPGSAAESKAAPVKSTATREPSASPSARKLMTEHDLKAENVAASGRGGRVVKEDVVRHIAGGEQTKAATPAPAPRSSLAPEGDRVEEVVPMTRLRKRIAERLVEAQHNAALLTTFNEIDLSEVIALRQEFQEAFQKKHGVKLGFMSFFVKAAIEALKTIPGINAEIRGENIVYKHFYDIGIAVGSGRGLVVPVLRHADRLSLADIEKSIADFGTRAQEGRIEPQELQGGTFTISNGGVYGSLLSTPIVNPPQSGVLGMHAIQERPIGRSGEIVLAPMMYVALTYDHRIVDGREAVTFLKKIKDVLERPARMLLDI